MQNFDAKPAEIKALFANQLDPIRAGELTGSDALSGLADLNPVRSVANNPGLRRMIAGSVANNVGLNARQLHLIPVENCADCRFVGFRLQVVTPNE